MVKGLLAYDADYIIILGYSQNEIEGRTNKFIKFTKIIGLKTNESETKYMIMSRRPRILQNGSLDAYKHLNNLKSDTILNI